MTKVFKMGEDNKFYGKGKTIPAKDCTMVIFGACGDLTTRLLLPTICHLGSEGLLSDKFKVVGVAGHDHDDESFREYLLEDVASKVKDFEAAEYAKKLSSKLHFVKGRFEDDDLFERLKKRLEELFKQGASENIIFYLAVPPQMFLMVIDGLYRHGLTKETAHAFRRVIIEKPFGHDLDSAIKLNKDILKLIKEHQIYRIDHYLGKETVQNLLAFRFANGIFEPIWNRQYIDHVQITVAESAGIGQRGGYYDFAGALRDMVPNHVFQLLSLIAMEPPISFESGPVRDEKAKLLKSIKCFSPEGVLQNTVRGQYDTGLIGETQVCAYQMEDKVAKNSSTPTYVAMKLEIDNWRWANVPFYIRTGKRLKKRVTEIAIQFKKAPSMMFQHTQTEELSANLLILHIQPEEGISLRFGAKVPGPMVRIGDVNMRFDYKDYFGLKAGTGYETLLYDCMMGDSTLYQRADMVEYGWRIVQPILDVWDALKPRDFPNYKAGSWGPKEADLLLNKDNRSFRRIGD